MLRAGGSTLLLIELVYPPHLHRPRTNFLFGFERSLPFVSEGPGNLINIFRMNTIDNIDVRERAVSETSSDGLPKRRTRKRWMIMMVMDDEKKREIERRYGKSIDDMDDDELERARSEVESSSEDRPLT